MVFLGMQMNGRKVVVGKHELIKIFEKYFQCDIEQLSIEEAPYPPEACKYFLVNPKEIINQKIFYQEREDEKQEFIRLLILEAFDEVMKHPEIYDKKFKTYVPVPSFKIDQGIDDITKEVFLYGDHMATWVEQALEWAQRIINGESWQTICNEKDDMVCYRLIIWKDGSVKFVGGNCYDNELNKVETLTPSSITDTYGPNHFHMIKMTNPLVVVYNEE